MNWRGRPLTSHEVVVATIASTRTRTGLRVHAELDTGAYPHRIAVTSQQLRSLPIEAHLLHGQWNYTIAPTGGAQVDDGDQYAVGGGEQPCCPRPLGGLRLLGGGQRLGEGASSSRARTGRRARRCSSSSPPWSPSMQDEGPRRGGAPVSCCRCSCLTGFT
jgi:hypothetical protein